MAEIIIGENPPSTINKNLALTELEFTRIGGIYKYWEQQPEYNKKAKGAFKTFNECMENYTRWTYEYLKQFWPNVEYKVLEYKKTFEIEACTAYNLKTLPPETHDTVAFKFAKGRPELFLCISSQPFIIDEMRFNAYENPDGKFKRPKWTLEG